jgi:hypothetical protein
MEQHIWVRLVPRILYFSDHLVELVLGQKDVLSLFKQHPHFTLISEGSWLALVAGIPRVAAPHELLDGRPI